MQKPARIDELSTDHETSAGGPVGVVRVWDPLVRIFHWTLVLSFVAAWLTAGWAENVHQWAGFYAAGAIVVRAVWGVLGTQFARFSQFVRGPSEIARYLISMSRGTEARYLGHNPAGGAMILVLMTMIIAAFATGWMMTTDTLFGVPWVGLLHSLIVHAIALLIVIHVAGVATASIRHKENLVLAMLTGKKAVD